VEYTEYAKLENVHKQFATDKNSLRSSPNMIDIIRRTLPSKVEDLSGNQ